MYDYRFVRIPISAVWDFDDGPVVRLRVSCDTAEIVCPSTPNTTMIVTPDTPAREAALREAFDKLSIHVGTGASITIGFRLQDGTDEDLAVFAILKLLFSGVLSEVFDAPPLDAEPTWPEA